MMLKKQMEQRKIRNRIKFVKKHFKNIGLKDSIRYIIKYRPQIWFSRRGKNGFSL